MLDPLALVVARGHGAELLELGKAAFHGVAFVVSGGVEGGVGGPGPATVTAVLLWSSLTVLSSPKPSSSLRCRAHRARHRQRRGEHWYGAVLRADQDSIFVGERGNIQDGCVLDADPACRYRWARTSRSATTPPGRVHRRTRSSSAWARSCSTGRTWDVTIVAAGALLTEGQQVPEGVLVAGVPGKVRRELSEAERAAIERNAAFYVELAELHHRGGM